MQLDISFSTGHDRRPAALVLCVEGTVMVGMRAERVREEGEKGEQKGINRGRPNGGEKLEVRKKCRRKRGQPMLTPLCLNQVGYDGRRGRVGAGGY